ncbi:MAG TPA: hypothetical protein VIN07_01085 [Flavipsychrobacter sp.]
MKQLLSTTIRKYWNYMLSGLVLIGLAVVALSKIWVTENDLFLIKGQISSADYYVTKNTDYRGRPNNISEVIFYLYDQDHKFVIHRGIDRHFHCEKHQKIQQQLRRCDSAKVWIKKSDINNYQPEIYRLHANNTELVSIDDVKSEHRSEYSIYVIFGLMAIILPVLANYFSEENGTEVKESSEKGSY